MNTEIPFFNGRIAPEGGSFDAWKTQSLLDSLEQGGLHPLLARLFAARGITSTDELDDALARLIPPSHMLGAQDAEIERGVA